MRLNFVFVFVFVLFPLVVLTACSHATPRSTLKNAVGISPASEKAIALTMGSGLMGTLFEAMPATDRRKALQAEYRALEQGRIGQTIAWQGEGNGNFGTVTAGQFYKVGLQNCRQYGHNFTIATTAHSVNASACRNEDGSWSPLL